MAILVPVAQVQDYLPVYAQWPTTKDFTLKKLDKNRKAGKYYTTNTQCMASGIRLKATEIFHAHL